jgi:hypothetical protein
MLVLAIDNVRASVKAIPFSKSLELWNASAAGPNHKNMLEAVHIFYNFSGLVLAMATIWAKINDDCVLGFRDIVLAKIATIC